MGIAIDLRASEPVRERSFWQSPQFSGLHNNRYIHSGFAAVIAGLIFANPRGPMISIAGTGIAVALLI
jgi:hypothetical protein